MSTTSPAREAFEAWYKSSHTSANTVRSKKGYIDNTTRVAWRAWQAAQQPDPGGVCGQCGGWVCDPIPALTAQHEQAMRDAITVGTGITQGGKRIDPTSIYEQPAEQEQYLTKAYRLANELRDHLSVAPAREPLTDNQMRSAFESWIADTFNESHAFYFERCSDGTYMRGFVREYWKCWQAAHGIKES